MLRAVDTTTGAVTTVAGSWTGAGKVDGPKVASRLKAPTALAFADDGQLYFTDGEWLRKLDPTSTVVSTVTSTSPAPKGLGGLAISKKRNKIFVSAPSDCVVRSIDRTSFVVSTIGGVVDECAFTDGSAASARFVTPTTLALDDAQDLLYVADRWGIRVLDLNTGNTSTLFGGVNRVGVRLGPLSTASVAHTLSDGMFIPFALVGPGDLILGSESALLRARK